MITVEQALAHVEDQARPLPAAERPLIECRGRILAEDVLAPEDAPPFDKALVDGYAVRAGDVEESPVLDVGETILAGRMPSRSLGPREAAVIMTGAPLPDLADSVVMHEETESGDGRVQIQGRGKRGHITVVAGKVLPEERLHAPSLPLGSGSGFASM